MTIFSPQIVGRTRDAEVHLAPLAQLQLDAPVLRETALGDVELAHDLEAADDGVLQLERRGHLLEEHAVDAEADAELLLVGLDVDVARPLLDRVQEDHVHEPHDRRVLARLLELEEVHVLLFAGEVDLLLVEAGHHLVVRGAGVVVLLDGRDDRRLARDDRLDVVAREELEVVDGVQVRRVGHRHDERVAGARDGDDAVLLALLLRDELHDVGVDLVLGEVDRRDAVLLREEVGDLVVRDVPELRERVAEVAAPLLLLLLRGAELREGDELLPDE